MNHSCKIKIFYIAVCLIFMVNFKVNLIESCENDFFNFFQYDSESLVIGRLLLSEQNSLITHAGFLGKAYTASNNKDIFWHQYEAY